MNKICYKIIILLLFVNSLPLKAQSSLDWEVEDGYQFEMSVVAFLNLNGKTLNSENDKVGVFVGNECRGLASLIRAGVEGKYYAYLQIFSDEDNKTMRFKIYDSTSDRIIDVNKTFTFKSGSIQGDLTQAYSIAEPKLLSEAEIISFSLQDLRSLSYNYDDSKGTLIIDVFDTSDITSLAPIFELTPLAEIFYEGKKVISGVTEIDFTKPVEVFLRSPDQSKMKTILVTINKVNIAAPRFFRKHVVCDYKGVIKVIYELEGESVKLEKNGVNIRNSVISNNEVIFDSLEPGLYQVKINNLVKSVRIESK